MAHPENTTSENEKSCLEEKKIEKKPNLFVTGIYEGNNCISVVKES